MDADEKHDFHHEEFRQTMEEIALAAKSRRQRALDLGIDDELLFLYEEISRALETALYLLELPPARDQDVPDPHRWGVYYLGLAGGLAFSGRLPGIESEALFDDISDAAEEQDLNRVDRIRRTVAARLRPDPAPDEPPLGKSGLDWAGGFPQMLAALEEAETAREEDDALRFSLMAGFLVGFLPQNPEFNNGGSLAEAVLVAHDRTPRRAIKWLMDESPMEYWNREKSVGSDPRGTLLGEVGKRLAMHERMSCPVFDYGSYWDQQEASIERARSFGKRIASRSGDGK